MTHAEEIDSLRSRIETLQAERAALTLRVRGRADVERQVRSMVDQLHVNGTDALARELQRAAAGKFPAPFAVPGQAAIAQAPCVAPFTIDIGGLLVAVLGKEAVCVALLRSLESVPEGFPTAAERAARLDAIGRELDELETEEEAAICSAELFGQSIARRSDARPEIILAS